MHCSSRPPALTAQQMRGFLFQSRAAASGSQAANCTSETAWPSTPRTRAEDSRRTLCPLPCYRRRQQFSSRGRQGHAYSPGICGPAVPRRGALTSRAAAATGAGRLFEPSTAFPCPRYSPVSKRATSFSSCCLYSCAAREVYCSTRMSTWKRLGSAGSHLEVLLLDSQVRRTSGAQYRASKTTWQKDTRKALWPADRASCRCCTAAQLATRGAAMKGEKPGLHVAHTSHFLQQHLAGMVSSCLYS